MDLRQRAVKRAAENSPDWDDITGAQQESRVFQAMLQVLEEEEQSLLSRRLAIARDAWITRAWSWDNAESFVQWLCDVGGRYQNEDGTPSGTAYDLANYVAIVWDALEGMGKDPLEIATSNWSKARALVPYARSATMLLDSKGQEVGHPEQAARMVIIRPKDFERAVEVVTNPQKSVRDVQHELSMPRVNRFNVSLHLNGDGTFTIYAEHLNPQQATLVQRLLGRYADVHIG